MIRWPWVLRSELLFAQLQRDNERERVAELLASSAAADARADAREADRDEWRVMYRELLALYDKLRIVTNANPAETFQPTPKPERDIVSDAIIVRSGNNVHLRRHYAEYVTFQRAAGIADVEIAAGILEGEVEDGGIP